MGGRVHGLAAQVLGVVPDARHVEGEWLRKYFDGLPWMIE